MTYATSEEGKPKDKDSSIVDAFLDEEGDTTTVNKGFFERLGLKKKQITPSTITKDHLDYTDEEESEEDENSMESTEEENIVPQTSVSTPTVKPHQYIKAKFSRLMLAQVISTSDPPPDDLGDNSPYGAIWTLRFNKDGQYLASAGQSCTVLVWKLQTTENSIQALDDTPYREYQGHTADILDIAWSKNDFLLSSSMDNTVRLWHVSQNDCLCVFQHLNFVTSVKFHPKDDRFFLSSSMDGRIRIWSIPEKRVAFWNEAPGFKHVTAVGFTLDGKTVIAGSDDGYCYFFETQGLKYNTQISILAKKNKKKGPKVTGIEVMPGMPPTEEKILISTNDSRVRLFNMKDKSLIFKYKGIINTNLQIKATFSDDGYYIISGSEDCHAYIWRTEQTNLTSHLVEESALGDLTLHMPTQSHNSGLSKWLKRRDDESKNNHKSNSKNQTEYFEAHDYTVTAAVFAPAKARQGFKKTNTRRLSAASDMTQEQEGHIIVTADQRGWIKVWRIVSSDDKPSNTRKLLNSTSTMNSSSSSSHGSSSRQK
ncbi:WD40 repeat-like protein [Rhizopus microsporus]|uniref:WD40 repeat-like protein n=1 Tax=Rhizopus microsporus TaxID=58291 RepID=A0A1X0RR58_RHIZD|nr:WD40 repeat-like protein [Rhizopus microsporus]